MKTTPTNLEYFEQLEYTLFETNHSITTPVVIDYLCSVHLRQTLSFIMLAVYVAGRNFIIFVVIPFFFENINGSARSLISTLYFLLILSCSGISLALSFMAWPSYLTPWSCVSWNNISKGFKNIIFLIGDILCFTTSYKINHICIETWYMQLHCNPTV